MKPTRTFIFALCSASLAIAQTNTFPSLGNVGVGTTSPTKKLTIFDSSSPTVYVTGNTESAYVGAYFIAESNIDYRGRGLFLPTVAGEAGTSWFVGVPYTGGGFQIGNSNVHAWESSGGPYVKGAAKLYIDGTAGNVGIGTTSPGAKLDIGGPTGATYGTLAIKQTGGGQKGIWLQCYENNNAISIHHAGTYAVVSTDYTGSGTHVPLALQVTGGNVGIGTTNPTHKLSVNGTIKAKEVIVETTGWSDYVFADDYPLQPLAEVEAHIKTNKHLPGIPSAAQVAEQGVSLGDMQAKLLAKIEELTLHQIAQEKELASLRQEVRALRENSAK